MPTNSSWATLAREATYLLAEAGVASPRVDARELAEYVCGARPSPAERATPQQAQSYLALVGRRARREPLQHITGRMYFRYLTLKSTPAALIVRPETEMVAGAAIDAVRRVKAGGGEPVAADLGTGSGAIAIALATEVPGTRVWAVDISAPALDLARENAAANGALAAITFVQADAGAALPELTGRCDVVVSNPPYVPPETPHEPEVDADPQLALAGGGPRGLDLPVRFLRRAAELVRPGGTVVMEHAEGQAAALREEAERVGLEASTAGDLTGRPRYLLAQRPAG